MPSLGKIRTINTRIRRYKERGIEFDKPLEKLLMDVDNFMLMTESGYISKSKEAVNNEYLGLSVEAYEEDLKDLKTMGVAAYNNREILSGILTQHIQPSDYYQMMNGSSNGDVFIDEIVNSLKSEKDKIFEDDEQADDFAKWLLDDYNANGRISERSFDKDKYHAKGRGKTIRNTKRG